jgi:8-amino-7-oxononanoate synthase
MVDAKQLVEWFPNKKAKAPGMKNANVFYRNLEEALDIKRAENATFTIRKNEPNPRSMDFSTLDFLHLSKSGLIRQPFLDELSAHPDFHLGAGGSRLLNGNNAYTDEAEKEIAEFHSGETSLLFHSGFEANVAIMVSVPRPGDAIVFDELVHASMHEGMQTSKALCKKSFKHNDTESFREVLLEIQESEQMIREGKRSILVALESLYSMDGDLCPLKELIKIGEEIFPDGNIQFFVDEAHTTGVFGHQGRGFVNELGLEHKVAIRMHTYGKALACTGGKCPPRTTFRAGCSPQSSICRMQ